MNNMRTAQDIFKDSQKTPEQKIQELSDIINNNPDDFIAIMFRVSVLMDIKEYSNAINDLNALINGNPQSPAFYLWRGHCYDALHDFENAIADYDKAINLKPDDSAAFYSRGKTHVAKKNYQSALKDFQKAFTLNPNDMDVVDELIHVNIRLKNYEEAFKNFQLIQGDVYDDTAEMLIAVAEHFSFKENYDEALEIYERIRYNNLDNIFDLHESIEWTLQKKHRKEKQALIAEVEKRRNRKFTSSKEFLNYLWHSLDTFRSDNNIQEDIVGNIVLLLMFYKRISDIYRNVEALPHSFYPYNLSEEFKWNSLSNIQNTDFLAQHIIKSIDELDNQTNQKFSEFISNINQISSKQLYDLYEFLNQYVWSEDNIPTDIFGKAFEEFLHNFDQWEGGKKGYTTPEEVKSLIIDLSDIKGTEKILDPAVGSAGLFTKTKRQKNLSNNNDTARFVGIEINHWTSLLARMNLVMNGIYDAEIINADALSKDLQNRKFDCNVAISDFPLNLRLSNHQKSLFKDSFGNLVSSGNSAFLSVMLNNMSERGKLVALVTVSFLFSKPETEFRKMLVEKDYLDTIIRLPQGIMNRSNVYTSIIKLDLHKNAHRKNRVLFVDLSKENPVYQPEQFQKALNQFYTYRENPAKSVDFIKEVAIDEIIDNDLNLDPQRYTSEAYKEVVNIDASYKPVKSIIKGYVAGVHKKSSETVSASDLIKLIKVTQLSNSQTEPSLNLDQSFDRVNREDNPKLLDQHDVLISLVGKHLKPTIVKDINDPIAISNNVMALELDKSRILPEYFVQQLYSKTTLAQIDLIRGGAGIPFITIKNFLNVKISVPPLLEQHKVLKEFQNVYAHSVEEANVEYLKALKVAQEKAYHSVGLIKHNLGQKMGMLINDFEILQQFMIQKAKDGSSLSLTEPVVPIFDGENEDAVENVSQILDRFYAKLKDTHSALTQMKDLIQSDRKKLSFELVDIKKALSDWKDSNYRNLRNIIFKITGDNLDVSIDKKLFFDVLDNIVDNAQKHGFIGQNRKYTIEFFIKKTILNEAQYCLIKYKNDGKPFPEGFTLEQFKISGATAGKNGNTGLGGFFINEVIEKHGGLLQNLISTPLGISYDILLPLTEKE